MRLSALLILVSCSLEREDTAFERCEFENNWWQIEQEPVCFNFHSSGQLLSYSHVIFDEGSWMFEEPNVYSVPSAEESIIVNPKDNCWMIEGYSRKQSFISCECTLRAALN